MQKWGEPIVFAVIKLIAAVCAVMIAVFIYR